MGVFTFIDGINNKTLFWYIIIIFFFLVVFSRFSVQLNIIFGIIIAVLVIFYLQEREQISTATQEKQTETKLEYIKPEPEKFKNHPDIIDFVFSVQDFYVYNPQAYEEFIDNLDNFFSLHRDIFGGNQLQNSYYQIAESKKMNAQNAFMSLIHSLPSNKFITEKFDRAHKRLETILNKYLNELYDRCQTDILRDGFDIYKMQINTGPKEWNTYLNKPFTYQFY